MPFTSLLQSQALSGIRGRVFASFDLLWQLGRLLSLLLRGLLAAAVGIESVYYLSGALLLLAGAIGWRGLQSRPRESAASVDQS